MLHLAFVAPVVNYWDSISGDLADLFDFKNIWIFFEKEMIILMQIFAVDFNRRRIPTPNHSSASSVPSFRYSIELRMIFPIFYESYQIFFPNFIAPGFLPRIQARQLSAFQIIECCSFAAMAKQAHLFLSKNIRHFRPINVIDFHNIHLCRLFGGRRLCMLCRSNIVLTFLTRILIKPPKSAHFRLSLEPIEKSGFFQWRMPNCFDIATFFADKTA